MIFALGNVETVAKRDLRLSGEFEFGRNEIILRVVDAEQGAKPGVLLVTPRIEFNNINRVGFIQLNPELLGQAEVTGPTLLTPDLKTLTYVVRPLSKELEISTLDWFAKIYILDTRLV